MIGVIGHIEKRAMALGLALLLAGCAQASAGLVVEGKAEPKVPPVLTWTPEDSPRIRPGETESREPVPAPPPAPVAAPVGPPSGAADYALGDQLKLRVLAAEGEMPTVRRTVQLLRLEQGAWQVVDSVNLPYLPGDAVSFQRADLPGHSGAVVIEADRTGTRKGVRKGAVTVENGRLMALDYYRLMAPDPEIKSGTYLYENKYLNQLWVFRDGQMVATFPTANGRDPWGTQPTWNDFKQNFKTPEGLFHIEQKVVCPPYNGLSGAHPSEPGCAPLNPLGTRWMGLAVLPGDGGGIWGFHGTYVPDQIGTWASEGCIRLNTKDAEQLFELVEIGTPVRIVAGR